MKIAIPYKHANNGIELKYTLRGIEKYIENPEIIIIGDKPVWIKNIEHIPFVEKKELQWKERNIFEKLSLVKDDFFYFNDDHFLLEPYTEYVYHYTGTLEEQLKVYERASAFKFTIQNTIDLFGNINNYFRHAPMFMKKESFEKISLDWSKEWGYCIKSVYCYVNKIQGVDYPDLKINNHLSDVSIKNLIKNRPYFSTADNAVNSYLIKVLEEIYPNKSMYE